MYRIRRALRRSIVTAPVAVSVSDTDTDTVSVSDTDTDTDTDTVSGAGAGADTVADTDHDTDTDLGLIRFRGHFGKVNTMRSMMEEPKKKRRTKARWTTVGPSLPRSRSHKIAANRPFGRANLLVEVAQEAQAKQSVDAESLGQIVRVDAKLAELVTERPKSGDPQDVSGLSADGTSDRGNGFTLARAVAEVVK